jgi:hypothetical protein
LPSVLSLDDVLVETLIIGLPFGIVYGLKANGNGVMNSGGDMELLPKVVDEEIKKDVLWFAS